MEKKEKTSKFGKSLFWVILSYVIISVIAGVCTVIRGKLQGDGGTAAVLFSVFELVLFPVLFFSAGYFGSGMNKFERFKTWKIWVFSTGFSAVLLLLWYVLLEVYVILNLPATEGSIVLDLFLRKTIVVKDYSVLYLKETDGYKYIILPLIHYVFRLLYWLLYSLGNRRYVAVQKEKRR